MSTLDSTRSALGRSHSLLLPNTEHDADHHFGTDARSTRQPSFPLRLAVSIMACLFCWAMGIWTARLWMKDHYCIRRSSMNCTSNLTSSKGIFVLMGSAPIIEEVHISLSIKRFNGSFFNESIFRKDASPEVDLAWEALGVNCSCLPPPSPFPFQQSPNKVKMTDQIDRV